MAEEKKNDEGAAVTDAADTAAERAEAAALVAQAEATRAAEAADVAVKAAKAAVAAMPDEAGGEKPQPSETPDDREARRAANRERVG